MLIQIRLTTFQEPNITAAIDYTETNIICIDYIVICRGGSGYKENILLNTIFLKVDVEN